MDASDGGDSIRLAMTKSLEDRFDNVDDTATTLLREEAHAESPKWIRGYSKGQKDW